MDLLKIFVLVFTAVIHNVLPSAGQEDARHFPLTPEDLLDSNLDVSKVKLNDVYAFATGQESTHRLRFSSWFDQQRQIFKDSQNLTDIKEIATPIIKAWVLEIFEKYNMALSNADGLIKGPKGEDMDSLNLELRPVFLGEKFFFQILDDKHTAIKLPKTDPFLESILVTLALPPMVLGVIPLAKINLPTSESSQTFDSAEDLKDLDLDVSQVNLNHVYTFESNQDGSQRLRFNTFFYDQLETRYKKIRSPTDIKVISSHVLKALVLKILSKYNVSLDADGHLKDAAGKEVDPLNLELRPMVIGRASFFQIFDSFETMFKLHIEDKSLDCILVTLVSPPQVLGIIPLAKTHLV